MAHLAVSLLGTFWVTLDGQPVTAFQSDKGRALLAYLAVESALPHRRERLAGLLWPEHSEAQARHSLSQALFNLRRITGDDPTPTPFLLVTPQTIQWNLAGDCWVDVAAFLELLTGPAPQLLEEASALYRGPFLAGFSLPDSVPFEEWALLERERLQRRALAALHRLAGQAEQAGATEQALDYSRRLLALDPLAEEAHRRAMRLLARLGRRGEALAQFEACRSLLAEELDAAPAPATLRLVQQIRGSEVTGKKAGETSDFFGEIGLLRAAAPRCNLPAAAAPFVGRLAEQAAVQRWLADPQCRLLTLQGMGGIGKTRLALHVAQNAVEDRHAFPGGVWLVELAPLSAADQLPLAIAQALGLALHQRRGDPRQETLAFLRTRRLLLLLDNAEHLLDSGLPALLADLLAAAPGLKVLATSRARLGLQSEQTLPLAGMTTPAGQPIDPAQARSFSALALFEQRAGLARPGFSLDSGAVQDAVAICRQVEGHPLAIELAAAWLEALPIGQIRAEIETSLDFLRGDLADLPPRHRSIRAVSDSMWRWLSAEEQAALARLAVFHGGCGFEAVQRVAGVTADILRGLVRKSLAQRLPGGRYRLHEVVRQFAAQKLHADPAAAEAAQTRYCIYFDAWLREQGERMTGPQQRSAFDAVAADLDNCRHAWLLSIERGLFDLANQALEGWVWYLDARGVAQSIPDLMQAGLERLPPDPLDGAGALLQARLLAFQAQLLAWDLSAQPELSRRALDVTETLGVEAQMGIALTRLALRYAVSVDAAKALRVLREHTERLRRDGSEWELAVSLNALGHMLSGYSSAAEGKAAFTESAAICRRRGDHLLLAWNLHALASRAFEEGDLDAAQQGLMACRDLYQSVGVLLSAADCQCSLARLACAQGDFAQGLAQLRAAQASLAEGGDWLGVIQMGSWVSITAARVGDLAEARRVRQQILVRAEQANLLIWLFFCNIELAEISRLEGDLAQAWQLLRSALELAPRLQVNELMIPIVYGNYYRIAGEAAQDAGDYVAARQLFQQALPWWQQQDNAWGIAYGHQGLGRAAIGLGELDVAAQHLSEALRQSRRGNGDMDVLTRALAGVVELLAARGQTADALALARWLAALPGTWEIRQRAAASCDLLAAQLPAELVHAIQPSGQSADLAATVEALLARIDPTVVSLTT